MKLARGQAFLCLVLFIGGMVVLAGLTLSFFALTYIDTVYGYQALTQAEGVANSGVQDALLQLDRNGSFSSLGYSVTVGSSTATVSATQNSPSSGFVTILSTATVSNRTRKMSVVVAVNTVTSRVTVTSWQAIQ